MSVSTSACPVCGAQASGNFCNNCGSALGKATCAKCRAELRRGAKFCPGCGTAVPPAVGTGRNERTPIIVAAVLAVAVLGLILVLAIRKEPAAQAQGGGASSAAAGMVDIANMTPRERFDRLYNRIMSAAETGDQATVAQFTPMAIMAYDQLDTADADARYHLALLKVHGSEVDEVKAIADTILAENPGHLFGYMIRGAVARFSRDSVALRKAKADFLAHYETEIAAGRQEYTDHSRAVDEFLKGAREGS